MKVYLLKDTDFERLIDAIQIDPEISGARILAQGDKIIYKDAYRFFNYQIRKF